MSNKKALIFGVNGQVGSYLAEYLLGKGYTVRGVVRRGSTNNLWRLDNIISDPWFSLVYSDLSDQGSIHNVIGTFLPDEVYNLAAQSFVAESFSSPVYCGDVTGLGALRILESIRQVNENIRYYQASTSELFGNQLGPQNEQTRFYPRSPYGSAKLFAHTTTVNYREAYDMYACCGIMFNCESPRRGLEFVTRKITNAAARISLGKQSVLELGNLDSKRDWGYAGDYVEAIHLMLQQDSPKDFVIGTGQTCSIRQFLDYAFGKLNLNYKDFVHINPKFLRPSEVPFLHADPKEIFRCLGWRARTPLKSLVEDMINFDLFCEEY